MRDPRPLPEAPDPRREPEGSGGGLRLGGASGPPAAGTRTCIRSPRASAEQLTLRASLCDAAPALAGELVADDRAGLFLPPGGPRADGCGRVLGTEGRGRRLWGPAGGSGPAGKLREGGAAQGARECRRPSRPARTPGRPGISGVGWGAGM